MQNIKKRWLCVALAFFVMLSIPLSSAQASTVSDAKRQRDRTKENLDNVNNQIDKLEHDKQAAQAEIQSLDAQLVDILTSISICEEEINEKERAIAKAKEELQIAQTQEEEQYEAMVLRIRFLYEQGEVAYWQLFLESRSIAEMINKAEMIEQLHAYDRRLLEEFQSVREEIATLEQQLVREEAELLTATQQLQMEKDALQRIIDQKKATVADFDSRLANARETAEQHKRNLQNQMTRIRQLEEEQRRAEQRAQQQRQDQRARQQNPTAGAGNDMGGRVTPGDSALGNQIVAYALQFVGNPYVWGGTSLTNGADCSGFTQSVYAHFGISIPRDSTSQRSVGREVPYSEAQPGDLICYAGHVAIYIGGGKIVHASTQTTGIVVGNATYRTILSVRRLV